MTKLVFLPFILWTLAFAAHGAESCGRTAIVNYQEVLVDASTNGRGEGLRYYLSKDPVAKRLLDQYQSNHRPQWQSAALSTLGTALILGGLLNVGGEDSKLFNRNNLLLGGVSLVGLSYLISRTNQYNNEYLLENAVEEYNRRNSPRIFFSADPSSTSRQGFGMGVQQEF